MELVDFQEQFCPRKHPNTYTQGSRYSVMGLLRALIYERCSESGL